MADLRIISSLGRGLPSLGRPLLKAVQAGKFSPGGVATYRSPERPLLRHTQLEIPFSPGAYLALANAIPLWFGFAVFLRSHPLIPHVCALGAPMASFFFLRLQKARFSLRSGKLTNPFLLRLRQFFLRIAMFVPARRRTLF